MMSKQLAVSTAFSVLMMAAYVLFGANAVREPLGRAPDLTGSIQISAPELPSTTTLLPALR
jgi:hypothetical protein